MSHKPILLIVILGIISILDNVNCKIIHLSPANDDILVNDIKIHPRQEDDESEEALSTADALAANLPGYAVGLNKVITGVNSRNPGQIFGGLFSFVPDNVRVGLNGAIDYLKPTIPTPSTTPLPSTTPAVRNATAPAALTQEQLLAQQLQQFQQFQQLQQFHQFQQLQQQAQQQGGSSTTPPTGKDEEVDENEDEDDYEDSKK